MHLTGKDESKSETYVRESRCTQCSPSDSSSSKGTPVNDMAALHFFPNQLAWKRNLTTIPAFPASHSYSM
jgi:hypothetical protein